MCRRLSVVFLAGLGGANAGACTPADQCPKLSDGKYCPVNDVTEHADINRDVKHISDFLKEDPPNYAEAKKVYTEGKESSKGGGKMRTLQSLAKKNMLGDGGKYTNKYYSGYVDLYTSYDNVWDTYIMACLDNTGDCKDKSAKYKKYIINKGLIGVVTGYVTYEMGKAQYKAADDQTTDGGAAYNWDEAAAFYIGNMELITAGSPGGLYSPYEFNWKRDKDFPDGLNTHESAVKVLNHGLLNIRGSDYDQAELQKATTTMHKLLSIAAIRSAIKYAAKARNNSDTTVVDYYIAEGAMYWRSASGYLSIVNKAKAEEVDNKLGLEQDKLTSADVCAVKAAVESLYSGLGITCATVGVWKDEAKYGVDTCPRCADPSDGDTTDDPDAADPLIAGSADYVDMCKAPEDETSAATGAFCQGNFIVGALAIMASLMLPTGFP